MRYAIAALGTLAGLAIVLTTSTAPAPAGACSIMCIGDTVALELASIELVEGAADAETPEWSENATVEAMLDGEAFGMNGGPQNSWVSLELDTDVED